MKSWVEVDRGVVVFRNKQGLIHREGWKPALIFPNGLLEFWLDNDCYYYTESIGTSGALVCDITTMQRVWMPIDGQ